MAAILQELQTDPESAAKKIQADPSMGKFVQVPSSFLLLPIHHPPRAVAGGGGGGSPRVSSRPIEPTLRMGRAAMPSVARAPAVSSVWPRRGRY